MGIETKAQKLLDVLELGSESDVLKVAFKHISHEDDCDICDYFADEHEEGEDAALNAMARNENTPDSVLRALADVAFSAPDAFGFLCDLIRENPNASEETLAQVDLADPE